MFFVDVKQLNCFICPSLDNCAESFTIHYLFFIAKQICCRSNSRQTAGRAPRNGLWPNQFIYNWKFSPKATGARSERAPTHYFILYCLYIFWSSFSFLELEMKHDFVECPFRNLCLLLSQQMRRKLEFSYSLPFVS